MSRSRRMGLGVAMAVYGRLLALAPRHLRVNYGDEMRRLFKERVCRSFDQGFLATVRVVVTGWIDVITLPRPSDRHTSTGDSMLTTLAHELRLALRSIRRAPGFSMMVTLTLTVSLAAVVTVMAVIDGAVLRPLPYPEPSQLYSIVEGGGDLTASALTPPSLEPLRDGTDAFDIIGGFSPSWSVGLAEHDGREERVLTAVYVADRTLDLFGVTPVAGRLMSSDEYRGRIRVAMVSEAFWRREFGGDSDALAWTGDQAITLDGNRYPIIGILPNTFLMPITASAVNPTARRAEVWLPFSLNPYYDAPVPVMHVVARLRAGVTVPQAEQQLARVVDAQAPGRPMTLRLGSLAELVSRQVKRPLTLLLAGVCCLLLICGANITSLIVARTTRRTGEMAVRTALGASRARLVLQLWLETSTLVVLGTVGGVVLAVWALSALPALLLADLPPSTTLAIDARVLAGAAGLCLLCVLGIGLWPALRSSRSTWAATQQLSARLTEHGATQRTRQVLAVVEVALAMVLLVGAGLMARSFWLMSTTNPGFNSTGLLATGIGLNGPGYPTADDRMAFMADAETRLAALPGVTAVGAVNRLPFSGANTPVGVEVEGRPTADGRPTTMDRRVATPRYFAAMEMALVEGRWFGLEDSATSTDRVAIVNEAAARFLLPGARLGQRVRLMLRGGPGPWLRVVGIVGDVRHHGLGEPVAPEIYVPYAQAAVESMVFVVRSAADPASLAAPVRDTMTTIDPGMRISDAGQAIVADLIAESVAEPRLYALLVNGFASVALLLAALGIVGVVSFGVAHQRREMGIRLALGADHRGLVMAVARRGLLLVGLGAVMGLAGGIVVGRSLEGLLFGVTAFDGPTLLAVAGVVAAIGWIAAYLPARSIASIAPAEILRPE